MSGTGDGYKSRLRGPGPVQGIGSAYAANQALAGAQDPEEAARIAAMGPSSAREEAERAEGVDARVKALRDDTLAMLSDLDWRPSVAGIDTSDWKTQEWSRYLSTLSLGDLERLAKDVGDEATRARDEEDEREIATALNREVSEVDPSDPLYDPLTDIARKREIESQLKPLDFEEMVWKNSCTQEVTLRSNFVVVFRTLTTQHGLWLEYFMSQQDESSWQHTRHLFSVVQVAATVDSINGRSIGPDLTRYKKAEQRGEYIAAIEQRLEFVGSLPGVLSDDLIVQYVWFTGRVRKLLSGDVLGKVGNS